MGVYSRGKKLWIRFRDAKGMWRDASTGYSVGQEELAQVMHDETVARIGATTKTVKHAPPGASPCAGSWPSGSPSVASVAWIGRPTKADSVATYYPTSEIC